MRAKSNSDRPLLVAVSRFCSWRYSSTPCARQTFIHATKSTSDRPANAYTLNAGWRVAWWSSVLVLLPLLPLGHQGLITFCESQEYL
jgi:hypothetical protein